MRPARHRARPRRRDARRSCPASAACWSPTPDARGASRTPCRPFGADAYDASRHPARMPRRFGTAGSRPDSARSSPNAHRGRPPMLRRHNRLLVAIYVVADLLSAAAAFLAGLPRPLRQLVRGPRAGDEEPAAATCRYLLSLPVIALLVPIAFQVQGLYRLRRGRTRVDDFFAVLVGSMLAVTGRRGRLALRAGVLPGELRPGVPRISRAVWAAVPGADRDLHLHLARGRARSASAPLACGHRPASAC